MRVSGTPQRPKPPHSRVVSHFMFSRAAEAEGRILLISLREKVVEKVRAWRQDWAEWSTKAIQMKRVELTERKGEAARGDSILWEAILAIYKGAYRGANSFNIAL